ncbi:class I ribonucleotide reductase maintenance protein YfaE [Thalassotalea eurytherma]|uniref:(2Fe-2S) ferredoxin n=1 Tax=Thalassotalea eurytherma TaxID=1144278 RepID=A0ABQ6H183_9GAMM|nr:class I ribonucleotide reductase maintenance protein YfaE [Thalassotalea eurytherma]GLX81956.1 (2Fe-2S) ferredoxin [Thalassotalea eurytherma]
MSNSVGKAHGCTISVGDISVTYLESHGSILNCLESADVEVHFHCRDGFCGACRVTLDEGQVNYPQGEPLAFVGDGEVLACCCQPTSNIRLTID